MTRPGFAHYFLGTLFRPSRTFATLMADPRRLRFGSLALLSNAFLYTLVYVFLALAGGAPSSFKPWLAIAPEHYYAIDRFMLAPSMIGCWILAAGLAQLLGRLAGGRGSFEDNLGAMGFAIAAASLASLVHDLPDSLLGAVGWIDQAAYEAALNSPTPWRTLLWICYGTSAALFLVLFPKAVRAAQGTGRAASAAIGIAAFAAYQGVFLVFNR
jgi:hypothetical protein